MKLAETLEKLGAGNTYCSWVGERPLEEFYASASAAEWAPWLQTWLWLSVRVGVAPRRVVGTVCACARAMLKYVVPGAERGTPAHAAVELTERWLEGYTDSTPECFSEAEVAAHVYAHGMSVVAGGGAQAAAAYVAEYAPASVRTSQAADSSHATLVAIAVMYMREAVKLNAVPEGELDALLDDVKVALPYRVVSAALRECLAGLETPAGAPS